MTRFWIEPQISISAQEIADGVSKSSMKDIMALIKRIDEHVQDWEFPVALFLFAAEMIESEDFLNDVFFLEEKKDPRVINAVNRLQEAIREAKDKLKNGTEIVDK